jgi:ribosomal protein S27E
MRDLDKNLYRQTGIMRLYCIKCQSIQEQEVVAEPNMSRVICSKCGNIVDREKILHEGVGGP